MPIHLPVHLLTETPVQRMLSRLAKFALLAGAMLSLCLAASAQANVNDENVQSAGDHLGTAQTVTFAPPEPAAAQGPSSSSDLNWQVAVGYQFNGIHLYATDFHTSGFNVSLARYFGNFFGIEVQTGAGFGNTGTTTFPANLSARSVFVGGGPRFAVRNTGRIEPWGHAVLGDEHFRFSQTTGPSTMSAFGWLAGGGVDLHASPRTAIRFEGDYFGTRFFGVNQRNYQVVAGLAFNF
jgi:hypothetical protein